MKNFICLFIFIALSLSLKSQEYKDYIIKLNNDTIKCYITDIDYHYIIYKYLDLKNGKVKTQIKLTDVKKYKLFKDTEEHNPNLTINLNTIDNLQKNEINIKNNNPDSLKTNKYLTSNNQLSKETKLKYEQKVANYNKMKRTGTTLTVLGVVGVAGGIGLTVSGANKMTNIENESIMGGVVQYEGGIALITVGGMMFIAGIVLNIVGKNNLKKYQNKLDIGIRYDNKLKGLSLVYKF